MPPRRCPACSSGAWSSCSSAAAATSSRFICGYLVCDPQLSEAFLGGLPPLIQVNIRDDPSGQWLENSLKFSVTQAANREAGADAMLTKLSEAVFAETLRRYVRQLPEGQTGWLAGARDAGVGKALTLLHHRPAHPWTVAELARETGLSRTVLSERFRHFLEEPPMAYLTRWRLRLGARALDRHEPRRGADRVRGRLRVGGRLQSRLQARVQPASGEIPKGEGERAQGHERRTQPGGEPTTEGRPSTNGGPTGVGNVARSAAVPPRQ